MDPRNERQEGAQRRAAAARPPSPPASRALSPLAELVDRVLVALSPLDVPGLTVSARDKGVIHLDGTVSARLDRDHAEQLARAVPGVTEVVNDLRVDPLEGEMPVTPSVLSPELAAEVELTHENFVRGTEMDFNDEDVGTIDTAEATGEAVPFFPPTDPVIRAAPRNDEGYEVVGGFSETSMATPINLEELPAQVLAGDDEIARMVRLALEEDASTTDLPIHVFVRGGVVHLRGPVPSLADAELAESVAARVPGVVEVREELDVAGM